MAKDNEFINPFGTLWSNSNPENDNNGIIQEINSTVGIYKEKHQTLKKQGKLKGKLNVFSINRNPVSYSFYLFSDVAFFVPSKNATTKEFYPMVLKVVPTGDEDCLFSKITKELQLMTKEESFTKLDLDE